MRNWFRLGWRGVASFENSFNEFIFHCVLTAWVKLLLAVNFRTTHWGFNKYITWAQNSRILRAMACFRNWNALNTSRGNLCPCFYKYCPDQKAMMTTIQSRSLPRLHARVAIETSQGLPDFNQRFKRIQSDTSESKEESSRSPVKRPIHIQMIWSILKPHLPRKFRGLETASTIKSNE
jgi:hypothetical protein